MGGAGSVTAGAGSVNGGASSSAGSSSAGAATANGGSGAAEPNGAADGCSCSTERRGGPPRLPLAGLCLSLAALARRQWRRSTRVIAGK